MPEQKPRPIRVEVPAEFGDAYDTEDGRQWVERRYRIGGPAVQELQGSLLERVSDEKKFKALCETMADLFVDWNLEGDKGPLPKPWQNPEAFVALYESDYELLGWVFTLPYKSIEELLTQKN